MVSTLKHKAIISTLILGGLEFLIASFFLLKIDQDPGNILFLGYSIARLSIVLLTIICALACLLLARYIYIKGRIPERLKNLISRNWSLLRSISILLFLFGAIVILFPQGHLQEYSAYFERFQPLLVVLTILPFQFFVFTLFKINREAIQEVIRPTWVFLMVLTLLSGFIVCTGLGIVPDTHFWNVAGVPLTTLQLILILLITTSCFYLVKNISMFQRMSPGMLDMGIALLIYIATVWVWSETPMVKHFYALRPAFPAFQYFPYSDARVHDVGALSIQSGYGINFGEYTDKPLYMIFLGILHFFTGNNYDQLSFLHLYCMALIPPLLFWFGKNFHGRNLGIAIALIILVRQRNAILLSHLLAGTNPRLLITELPTLLMLVIFCNIMHSWIKESTSSRIPWQYALLAGGILGAASLIRLNPVGLLPVILIIITLIYRKKASTWLSQVVIFSIGFMVVFSPWLLTGRDINGQSYLWTKINDVITVRYPHIPFIEKKDLSNLHVRVEQSELLATVEADNRDIPMQEFPIFVINHSLHNMITTFLALPDSPFPKDQDLRALIKRPYLDEKQTAIWNGSLQPIQLPFIIINLLFLAIGLGWSWRSWKWIGIFPAVIFVTYAITLGFARSSGSRYIVPVDWIVFFYYILGIILVIEYFFDVFTDYPDEISIGKRSNLRPFSSFQVILFVLFLAVLIPLAQIPIITKKFPLCNSQVFDSRYEQLDLVRGKALYPYAEEDTFYFVFFVCGQRSEINLSEFNVPLQHGQTIIIGFSKDNLSVPQAIFLEENLVLVPVWSNK